MTQSDHDMQIKYNYEVEEPDLRTKSWSVHDQSRTVDFTGVRLAGISSIRPGRPRWTNITLYRTSGGLYIGYRVGVSLVVHDISCMSISGKRLPGIETIKPGATPAPERVACQICRPNIVQSLKDDPASIRVEVDRHWTAICDTPEELYQELHTMRQGEKTFSYMASTLFVNAAENDPLIAEVVRTHSLV